MSKYVAPKNSVELDYYSFDRVLSHNAVYNFVVGARGLGKTYGAKKKVISDYINKGWQFIYVRRYSTELKTRITFFADIAHEFPDYGFRVSGWEAQITRTPNADKPKWETFGYFVPLSSSQSMKSVAFPKVRWVIFDEFIIEKGAIHYLPEEANIFNNFFSTVDRYKDKTRVLFLANALTIMNPYFLEYSIRPDGQTELYTSHGGFIAAHFPDSAAFTKGVFKTRFGKFIENTEYANMAVGNLFGDNTDNLIGRKPPEANYRFTLITESGTMSIWTHDDGIEIKYYVQKRRPKKEFKFTIDHKRVAEDTTLLTYGDRLLQHLRGAYSKGRVMFDSPVTRNAFIGVYKR